MGQAYKTQSPFNTPLIFSWPLGLLAVFACAPIYSQSLGDIARQERERKESQPQRTTHVYDNDDLARPQILLPEDQERAQGSKKKVAPSAGEPPAESAGSDRKVSTPPQSEAPPRGVVARHDRAPLAPAKGSKLPA